MFVSTYETSLDSKGRVSVPASFRHALSGGQRLFLWPASDGSPCLEGGGEALMTLYRQTLARMSPNDPADLKMDDTGRISIPRPLLEGAGIEGRLIFAGALDRFHIWEPDRFAAFDAVMEGQLRESQDALDAPFQAALAAGALKLDGEGMA